MLNTILGGLSGKLRLGVGHHMHGGVSFQLENYFMQGLFGGYEMVGKFPFGGQMDPEANNFFHSIAM